MLCQLPTHRVVPGKCKPVAQRPRVLASVSPFLGSRFVRKNFSIGHLLTFLVDVETSLVWKYLDFFLVNARNNNFV
jgi:hypothetical protein